MQNPRPEKVAVVAEVRARLERAEAAMLTEYRGLNVSATADLRKSLRAAGGEYKIYKNTLVRFAAHGLGLDIDHLLTGPTAIAFVDGDPVLVAKALRDFARTNPALVVKGGLLGETPLDAAAVTALADVEPREVLLARLAGAIAAPMQQFAGLLQALPRNLAYGLKALIDDRGGVPEAPPDAASPEPADEVAPEPSEPDAAPAPIADPVATTEADTPPVPDGAESETTDPTAADATGTNQEN